jgi:hypothetical protein
MPPRRWHLGRRTQMSAPIRRYLCTGHYGSAHDFDYDAFELAGAVQRGNFSAVEELWARHGATLLEEWIAAHPGQRPHVWWLVAAGEPRRVVRGIELRVGGPARAEHWWRPRRGIPYLVQVRPDNFVGYPAIEAEARYLDRLELLADAERERVPAGGWEPVEINPFVVDRLAPARPETTVEIERRQVR